MAYMIPDNVLQYQICSVCKKYLSYPPTKIYKNGVVQCGRCSHSDDEGIVSVFEAIAKNLLFPCINRFEGCNKVLHYVDVKEHEKNCVGNVVECPICPRSTFPLLFFLNHFKMKHYKNVLTSSVIDVDLRSTFPKYFLKYDNEYNRIFIIILNWDTVNLSVDAATMIQDENVRNSPRIQVSLFTDDAEETCLYKTTLKDLSDLRYYLLNPFQEGLACRVSLHLTNIRCKLIFDCTSNWMKINQFCLNDDVGFKKRTLPKMYLDSKFKEKYKNLNLTKFKLSECGQKLIFGTHSLQIACDFCGNFFPSSGFLKEIYCDANCAICGTCYSRGITKSLVKSDSPIKKLEDIAYDLINFYCKFGCKKFFRSCELLTHEDQCIFNPQRILSEENHVKSCFGAEFKGGSKFSRENVIIFEPAKFKGTGKIFLATRDKFKCVIEYARDDKLKVCIFHVIHEYDINKYYISIHKWESKTFSMNYNDFSMKTENCDGPSLFAVNLKEINEELEIFNDV